MEIRIYVFGISIVYYIWCIVRYFYVFVFMKEMEGTEGGKEEGRKKGVVEGRKKGKKIFM